jgi:hypothetical protein
LTRGRSDLAAYLRAASERDPPRHAIGDDRLTDLIAGARHDAQDARGQARLLVDLGEENSTGHGRQ